MRTACGVCTAISLALIGCSQEDWQWGGKQNKSANADAGTKARPPKEEAKPETDSQSAKSASRDAPADDPQARDVENRVANYANTVQTRYDGAPDGGDFNSKIARHNDPEYRRRIRQTALTAYERSDRDNDVTGGPPPENGEHNHADSGTPGNQDANDPGESSVTPQFETSSDAAGDRDPAETAESVEAKSVMPPVTPPQDANKPATPDAGSAPNHGQSGSIPSEEPKAPVLAGVKTGTEPGRTMTNGSVGGHEPAAVGANKPSNDETEKPSVGTNSPSMGAPKNAAPDPIPAKVETVVKDTYRDRIHDLEGRVAKDPNNIDDQLRLRMLYLASGEDEKAVAVSEGMYEDNARLVTAYIEALKKARAQTGQDPASWANEQLPTIEALRDLIRSQADLQVPRVMMCESIEGYGVYEPIEPPQFVQGQKGKALLYIEVDNYQSEKTASGKYRTLLSLRLSLLDKNGKELWSQPPTDNIEDVSRERRRDFFLTYGPLTIPKDLGPGTYVLKVEVEDVLAQKTNSGTAEFKIVQR